MVLATLMFLYTLRHVDSIFGFGAPEPLARMYSRSFYRVTWIVTALDAGFATAMNVKPKWLRDILSMVFSAYYVLYANEADEKLRKYRAFCTVINGQKMENLQVSRQIVSFEHRWAYSKAMYNELEMSFWKIINPIVQDLT